MSLSSFIPEIDGGEYGHILEKEDTYDSKIFNRKVFEPHN